MKIEISIIIPIYNTEQYMDKCVASVISQTYQNYEIILVDDGSTDGSPQKCDGYAAKYSNIEVLHNQNQGPAAARKSGLEAAKGRYIMFVDSDDWVDKNIVKILYNHLKKSEANMVCSHFVNINKSGKEKPIKTFKEEYIDCNNADESMSYIHKSRYFITGPVAKLFERELFENIDFHSEVTIGEDYSMTIQLVEKAKKVRLLSQILYFRLVRKDNISHSGYTELHKKALRNYINIRNYLIERYPKLKVEIIGYHIEYEMAVITAMCRNKTYDKIVIIELVNDLRENMRIVIFKTKIAFYMKLCAFLIAYAYPVFIIIFRIIHLLTGR